MLTLILIIHKTGSPLQERVLNRNIINIIPLLKFKEEVLTRWFERVIHKEYASFQERINETLARKWSKPYSQMIEYGN